MPEFRWTASHPRALAIGYLAKLVDSIVVVADVVVDHGLGLVFVAVDEEIGFALVIGIGVGGVGAVGRDVDSVATDRAAKAPPRRNLPEFGLIKMDVLVEGRFAERFVSPFRHQRLPSASDARVAHRYEQNFRDSQVRWTDRPTARFRWRWR